MLQRRAARPARGPPGAPATRRAGGSAARTAAAPRSTTAPTAASPSGRRRRCGRPTSRSRRSAGCRRRSPRRRTSSRGASGVSPTFSSSSRTWTRPSARGGRRCTAGSKANTWPALPGSSDHTTRPDLSHTLMCTIDWSCRRLRMIRENDSTRAGSPATNRPSASGAVTTRAKVAPRLSASLTATSRLTCRATTTVAAATTSSTTPPVRTKRSRARRTTDRGGPVCDSGAGMDIDEPVPDGDGDGLPAGSGHRAWRAGS